VDNYALHCGDTESLSQDELTVLCDVHKRFREQFRGDYEDTELRKAWESCAALNEVPDENLVLD